MCTYIYIYIERERESEREINRERERERCVCQMHSDGAVINITSGLAISPNSNMN